MKKLMALLLALSFVLVLVGCAKSDEKNEIEATTDNIEIVVTTGTEPPIDPTSAPVLDCKSLETACAEGFIDPSKVTVLGGEWAYTADPNKFVALASVKYTNKYDEYVTAEYVMVGVFGGEIELYHCLNQHSPYTRENALQAFGAIDGQRFPLA